MLSKYQHFHFHGRDYIYNGFTGALAEVDKLALDIVNSELRDMQTVIMRFSQKYSKKDITATFHNLAKTGFFRQKRYYPTVNWEEKIAPKEYGLILTEDCNLRCKYCYEGLDKPKIYMTREKAKEVVDYIIKTTIHAQIGIIFFGGEPLLNLPVLKYIIEYADQESAKYGKKIFYGMTTNGVLLTKEIYEYLRKNNVIITLSIDGVAENHDSMRVFPDGKGSYEVIRKNIKTFPLHGVIGRGSTGKTGLDLIKNIQHLAELGFKEIFFDPASGNQVPLSESDYRRLMDNCEGLYDFCLDNIVNKKGKRIVFLERFIRNIHNGWRNNLLSCGAGNRMLAIDPSGDIYFCMRFIERKEFLFGNIAQGLDIKKISGFLKKIAVKNRGKGACRRCWAEILCTGECVGNALDESGDVRAVVPMRCLYKKKLIETAIRIYTRLNDEERDRLEDLLSYQTC
ncbi:MAG: radical SAM protein [Bacillota bacterium]